LPTGSMSGFLHLSSLVNFLLEESCGEWIPMEQTLPRRMSLQSLR
jgi:hypothetical protein